MQRMYYHSNNQLDTKNILFFMNYSGGINISLFSFFFQLLSRPKVVFCATENLIFRMQGFSCITSGLMVILFNNSLTVSFFMF